MELYAPPGILLKAYPVSETQTATSQRGPQLSYTHLIWLPVSSSLPWIEYITVLRIRNHGIREFSNTRIRKTKRFRILEDQNIDLIKISN